MKISEIGKNSDKKKSSPSFMVGKTGRKFNLKGLRLHFKLSAEKVLWVFFIGVLIIEVFVVYDSVIKNLFFEKPSEEQTESVAVRVNFDNFNRVTERLDKVLDFRVSGNIDFTVSDPGIGRSSPFSNPE